jgi:hypothetical protein
MAMTPVPTIWFSAVEKKNVGMDQAVVRQCLSSALLAFANRIQSICEFARGFSLRTNSANQRGCCWLTTAFEYPNQMVQNFPVISPRIRGWIPFRW